jgi:hypothetical protein
MNLYSNE